MTIWVATEYVLTEDHPTGIEQNVGYYSSKQKAIDAIYAYLRFDFDESDIENRVKRYDDYDEIDIVTECGDDYGMYDCRYEIVPRVLDEDFGE